MRRKPAGLTPTPLPCHADGPRGPSGTYNSCSMTMRNPRKLGGHSGFLLETSRTRTLPMSFHSFRTVQSLCLLSLVLASQFTVSAEESTPSLAERKLRMLRGTSTGIVIFDFEKSHQSAAPTTAKSDAQTKTAAESQPHAPSGSGPLSEPQLPSGRSLNELRRLGTGDGGMVVPTSPTPSKPHADPWAKP